MLKDLLTIGLGSALLAKEKVEDELNKLVEKGKISKDEAQKFIDDAKQKAQDEEEKLKDRLKSALKEVLDELNIATKDDIEDLKSQLKK